MDSIRKNRTVYCQTCGWKREHTFGSVEVAKQVERHHLESPGHQARS